MVVSHQGSLQDRYKLTPRTLIFISQADQVLLLKGSPHKRLWPNLYNGLGGHVEQGEDILSAARRELKEETGLEGIHLWLCGIITIDSGQASGIGIFVVRGEVDQPILQPSTEGSPEWIPIHQITTSADNKLALVEDLPILIPRVLAVQSGDPPFSANYLALPGEELVIHFYSEEI